MVVTNWIKEYGDVNSRGVKVKKLQKDRNAIKEFQLKT